MTTQNLRLKIASPSLRLLSRPIYPLKVAPGTGVGITSSAGTFSFGLDYSLLAELPAYDPTQKLLAVVDRATGLWNRVSLASVLTGSQTVQIVTAAGDVTVQPNDGLIILNKTVSAATAVTLPLSSLKVGPVRVVDFKGDASQSQPITANVSGADLLNGGQTSWRITGPGASILFSPISGLGYAVS